MQGQTGFPWIDAIMTQLREEGWIHHLARHAVACFLTRGDLWLSWEEGMKVIATNSASFTILKPASLKGIRRTIVGCRLVRKRWNMDVAVLLQLLPTVLPLLLPRQIRPKGGSQRRLHQVFQPNTENTQHYSIALPGNTYQY